jgi:hypothetical protein
MERQLYLGGFEREALAALAYDLGAVYFRGAAADTNFPLQLYSAEMEAAGQVRGSCCACPPSEGLQRVRTKYALGSLRFHG